MLGSEKKITKPKNPILPIWLHHLRPLLLVTVAEPLDTSVRNVPFALLTHQTSEEAVVEAKAEARAAADEEAADEVAVEDFHNNVVAAPEAEMTILPADTAEILVHPRKENVTFAAILITRPILVIKQKIFELF